ncbi:MAG: CrcB family protein [bacterium]
MKEIFLVAAMGSLGALLRWHFGGYVHSTLNRALASKTEFPFGTLFVNTIGSFFLGVTTGLFAPESAPPLASVALGAGFCGSLTTFSTLAVDLQRFLSERRFWMFFLCLSVSTVGGIAAFLLGLAAVRIVS